MQRYLIILTLCGILLAACAPAAVPATSSHPAVENSPTANVLPSATPAEQDMPSFTPEPTHPQQDLPTATARPRGKNPSPAATSTNPDFIATEILGRPTGTSVTVNLVPAVPMEIYYEVGTAPGVYSIQTSPQHAAAGEPLETLIDGLQPDTRYYYRLSYNNKTGAEHTFYTQRLPGSAFSFAIQGDSHPERLGKQFDPGLYTRTLQSAAASQPDFYLTIGDDFSVDTLKDVNPETVRALYINQRQYLGLVDAPLFLVNGNHEQASLANLDGTPDNVAVWAQTARNAYYPQPAPDSFYSGDVEPVEHIGLLRDYYAFTWGDALFVVIDPYWHSPQAVDNAYGADRQQKGKRDLWSITLGDTQYQWLKQTLENSEAPYKFVFAHHVNGTGRGGVELASLYEWGGQDRNGSDVFAQKRPGWEKPIHQLMADSGVTIFFQGHDHIFARQELDGVIYQTLPEPANPTYSLENEQAYQSGDKLPNSGYLRITVSPEAVRVDYIRTFLDKPDEVAFSYTVP